MYFHCLYHSLKVFFEEKQYFFADLPPNSAFPNLTLDAPSIVIIISIYLYAVSAISSEHKLMSVIKVQSL